MYEANGKIHSTMLGIEDHGIMTFFVNIDFGGSGQGFGGYALDGKAGQVGHSKSIQAIRKILQTVDVTQWEDLKGKYVRVRKDKEYGGTIKAIGHIIEDKWFDIGEFWKAE
jgi:hypothetical protein